MGWSLTGNTAKWVNTVQCICMLNPKAPSETPGAVLTTALLLTAHHPDSTEPPEPAARRQTPNNVILTSNPLPSWIKKPDVEVHFLGLQEAKEVRSPGLQLCAIPLQGLKVFRWGVWIPNSPNDQDEVREKWNIYIYTWTHHRAFYWKKMVWLQ